MLYTIGEFAALNKISARMLRHYDKIGLLKPSFILRSGLAAKSIGVCPKANSRFTQSCSPIHSIEHDSVNRSSILTNGYRAYSSSQISAVSRIRYYQSCRFSLAQIGKLLSADTEEIRRLAELKLDDLRRQEKEDRLAWNELAALAGGDPHKADNRYDISFTCQSARTLFCPEQSCLENGIETAIDNLYGALERGGAEADGLLMLIVNLRETPPFRAALPVKTPVFRDGYGCAALEPGWYLSTFHYGDYLTLSAGYDALFRYAQEHGYTLNPPFYEQYFVDAGTATDPAQYITQILIAVSA